VHEHFLAILVVHITLRNILMLHTQFGDLKISIRVTKSINMALHDGMETKKKVLN
jgi:hypothetical protein